jgi:hypothetical protein
MSSDGGLFGTANVHVGADWTVRCHIYPVRAENRIHGSDQQSCSPAPHP